MSVVNTEPLNLVHTEEGHWFDPSITAQLWATQSVAISFGLVTRSCSSQLPMASFCELIALPPATLKPWVTSGPN